MSPDRHLAGTLAEQQLGCTVHLLDDGFQHLELARNLDVLVTTIGEIPNGRVMPLGRLREPMDAAARAHFLVVSDATAGAASAEAWTLGISAVMWRGCELWPRRLPVGVQAAPSASARGIKVLGSRRRRQPSSGSSTRSELDWNVVETIAFPDHHRYTAADIAAIDAKLKAIRRGRRVHHGQGRGAARGPVAAVCCLSRAAASCSSIRPMR